MTGVFNQYIVTDQVTTQTFALEIFEGELYWVVSGLPTFGDPILQDGTTYWDLGMSNGLIEWTSVSKPASGGDLVYLVDSATGLYYQLLITGGELYWVVATPQLGGSSGPINPYDYINIFTDEKFERKVVVKGDKVYLTGVELGFEGSKSFYDGTSLKVYGGKRIQFKECKNCIGSKQYVLSESIKALGQKSLDEYSVIQFKGTKTWSLNESRSVVGKRDITNILEALDLF